MSNAKPPTAIRLLEPVKYLRGEGAESKDREAPVFYETGAEEQPVEYNARCMIGHSSSFEERQQRDLKIS